MTGEKIPIGMKVGTLKSDTTLSIQNGPCQTDLPLTLDLLNASINTPDTVTFDKLINETVQTGVPDGIEKCPDFNSRIFPGLEPIRRSAGVAAVAGTPVFVQFLTFKPGTAVPNPYNKQIPIDPSIGYPTVAVVQNQGDPQAQPQSGPVTGVCTPFSSTLDLFGQSPEGTTLLVNPKDGTYTFTTLALGLPDQPGGDPALAEIPSQVKIGSGAGPGGPPEGFGPNEGGGGLGTPVIVAIGLGAALAVVIVSSGAVLYGRRRRGRRV